MTTITFDTLKFVERLTSAGVSDIQARAEANALRDVLSETLDTALASRADIARLERQIAESKFELLKWIVGLAFAQFSLLIGILMKLMH